MAETSAKERLIALLGYCKELTTLHASDAKPTLELKSDDETTVLHETSLKRLQELKRTNGLPVLWLPEGGAACVANDGGDREMHGSLAGGGANLRTLQPLGGGSDPPKLLLQPLGGV